MTDLFLCRRRIPPDGSSRGIVKGPLEEAGYRVTEVEDGPLPAGPKDVVLVLGNAHWYPALRRWLRETRPARRSFVVVWHTEPLPLPNGARPRRHARELAKVVLRDRRATDPATNHAELRRLAGRGLVDLVVVGGRASHELLRGSGIAAEWVPVAYDPAYGSDLGLERDIDVMFLGATDVPRRRRALRRLRRAGVDVLVAGSWRDPRYWGDQRTRLLNRVRILINLPRRPGEMSGLRLVLGMANGALVVSEPIYDSAPYVPGEHYVSTSLDEMPATIDRLLADEEARARLAAAGHRFATTEVTFDRSVRQVVELIEKRRAARGYALDRGEPRKADRPSVRQ